MPTAAASVSNHPSSAALLRADGVQDPLTVRGPVPWHHIYMLRPQTVGAVISHRAPTGLDLGTAVQASKALVQVPRVSAHLGLRFPVKLPPNELLARPIL